MYHDRTDAGRRLGEALAYLASPGVVVLGLPRGGVVVAHEVAVALGAPLDVIVVRKVGVPSQPELAMGALGEGGVVVVNEEVLRIIGLGPEAFAGAARAEHAELDRRAAVYRRGRTRLPVAGRLAILVDDGIATGSTARAACRVARAMGAVRTVLAVPVGPSGIERTLADDADAVLCLASPPGLLAIGEAYLDFSPTTDAEVVDALTGSTD